MDHKLTESVVFALIARILHSNHSANLKLA